MNRSAAILMAISSLPSKYGIGTFGKSAYDFVDFLSSSGQSYWQLLPLGPTSYGDSPYQSFSTFAGNPYYVDLDLLIGDGLLSRQDVERFDWGSDKRNVDYSKIYDNRFSVLSIAKKNGWDRDCKEIQQFIEQNQDWLPDYALFMALKRFFGMRSWNEWEDESIKRRNQISVKKYNELLKDDVELFEYIQFLFFKQWNQLKNYAHSKNIKFIGDVPIYVAYDSSDVWAKPHCFQLDENYVPTEVAGVPPDYFSEYGQLWGNPLYDYDAMSKDGYSWWLDRIEGYSKLYDVIRIDHFRGFESYWAVPNGETTAKNGRWVKGPGMDLVGKIQSVFPNIDFIAEDLGYPTPQVEQLLDDSKMPGMRVLQFAFNANEPSSYLPHNYCENCICYTGTHDNPPLSLWKKETGLDDIKFASEYVGIIHTDDLEYALIRAGMCSVAKLFVAQMQDYLGLGDGNRMNVPGTSVGNWKWRMLDGELDANLAKKIHRLTLIYGRLNQWR